MKKLLSVITLALGLANMQAQEVASLSDTLQVNGSVGARFVGYGANGIDSRRNPLSYVLYGNINIQKGDFSIPLSFTYSEQERSFTQPFNQFGIAPTYKWIKVYAGYQNVNWSKFGMAGHQLLGGGLELTPGKWRFGVVGGRLQRATGIDSVNAGSYLPMFKRTGYTAKLGYGTQSSFCDLVFFQAKDDPNSLPFFPTDSTAKVLPGQNTVVSFRSMVQVSSAIGLYADGALSIINRNVLAPVIDANKSGIWNINGPPNISTQVYAAIEAGTNISFKSQNFNFNYKRITPDYNSYGAYFIENDINAFNFRHGFAVWKNKIALNYGLGMFSDNLLNKKLVTTTRYQPNVNVSFNPTHKFGIDVNWMDVYTSQADGLQAVNDTIRMDNRNPGLTITPRYSWGNTTTYNMFMLNYMNMRMIDRNAFTSVYAEYSTQIINLMYSLTLGAKGQGFTAGLNRTENKTSAFDEVGYGGSAGYNQSWKEGKISANATVATQFTNINTNVTFNTGGNYNLTEKQIGGLMLTYLINRTENENSRNFSEFTGVLSYTLNF